MSAGFEEEGPKEPVKLSVIVSSIEDDGSLRTCLDSILPQKTGEMEIIATVVRSRDSLTDWTSDYSEVDFIEYPAETTLAALVGDGIARSRGEIIAITDSSCIAGDDWLASILAGHETEFPVIGGSVEMLGEGAGLTDWAAYFCDYGQFMLPAASGVVTAIPGNNFSIKRPVLERGRKIVENEFWKTLWCNSLQSEGIELFSQPKILVSRGKKYKLAPFMVERFHRGRCFAGMRSENFSGIKRLAYTLGTPMLPIVFFIRTVAPVIGKRRYTGKLLLSVPVIILAGVLWAAGEAAGYFAGRGDSCQAAG